MPPRQENDQPEEIGGQPDQPDQQVLNLIAQLQVMIADSQARYQQLQEVVQRLDALELVDREQQRQIAEREAELQNAMAEIQRLVRGNQMNGGGN